MKERVEFRKHGLLVLILDNQASSGQDDTSEREDQHLLGACAGQEIDDHSADARQEAGDLDGPILQRHSADSLGHAEEQHDLRSQACAQH